MNGVFDNSRTQAALELAMRLIREPTVNEPPNGNEMPGQAILKSRLLELGLDIEEFSPAELPEYPQHHEFLPRNLGGRKNLIGRWRGSGGGRSLLLTGHMDVVPIHPLPWVVTEPFVPLLKEGKLYGRGAADMKAAMAVAVEALALLKASGFVPKGEIVFESVVDEEFAGANGTIASRLKGINPDFGVLLEASGLNVCPACVGGLLLNIRVQGIAGMPYTGEEIENPAYDISELALLVREFSEYRMRTAPKPALWDGTVQGAQIVITKLKAGEAYEHGQLSAPIDGWMQIVMQSYPGETADDLEAAFRKFLSSRGKNADGLQIEREYHYIRPAQTAAAHPGVELLHNCAAAYTDRAKVCGAMFSCDLYALTEIGQIPSVIFGPVGGRLHAPDEWVDVDSLRICGQSLADFIFKWCG